MWARSRVLEVPKVSWAVGPKLLCEERSLSGERAGAGGQVRRT